MPFELTAEKLVYGGAALGHARGRTVLVPFALPGERLEVETTREMKGVVHARIRRVLEPAATRIEPPCPYFTRCGGCHYQHFGYEDQLATKVEILLETLRRLGKIHWDEPIRARASPPWNYRNQAQFKISRLADGRVGVGFFESESHRLVEIAECRILSPRLNALLAMLRSSEWSERLAGVTELEVLADDGDEHVLVTLRGPLADEAPERLAKDLLASGEGIIGVALDEKRKFTCWGEPALEYSVGEFRYRVSAGAFFQASRYLLPALVSAATDVEGGEFALELFAGVGLLTLPLARRFKNVTGVELHPRAAADLRENVRRHSFSNVRVVAGSAHDYLRRFARGEPDLVVLDPPRAGAGVATLKLLLRSRPRQIHYVSCSPPTLARDLAFLLAQGYRLESVELFDLFPQTYHVECLARLKRNA